MKPHRGPSAQMVKALALIRTGLNASQAAKKAKISSGAIYRNKAYRAILAERAAAMAATDGLIFNFGDVEKALKTLRDDAVDSQVSKL